MVSCSPSGKKTTPVNTTSIITTNDNSDLLQENNKLKSENGKLSTENDSLKSKNEYLEKNLTEARISPLLSNYTTDELLQKIFTEKSKVNIFPGALKSIRVEEKGNEVYFVFSIDKMLVNPKWDGPGSDAGRGYFINSEKKYEEYKGGLGTVFSYQGYEDTEKKREAILADPKYSNNQIFNFYMIGDEIVYVGPDPGP
jgi:hypothetical protein